MPYRFDIRNIDDDFCNEPDESDFYHEIEDKERGEEDYYDATHTCDNCYGIGDWCPFCKGTGTIKSKYSI